MEKNSVNERQNVSFKFSKVSSKVLKNNLDEEKDFVTSVDKKEIKSSAPKLETKELIIPLIKKNAWRVSNTKISASKTESKLNEDEKELNNIAISELIKEATKNNAAWENRDSANALDAIPLILQNKIPDGFETDDKMDVSLRPDESTLEDYDRIPIEQFGLAMLKGMGWKEGDGIGANKQCVKPVLVELRPKGLGLGADATMLKKNQQKAKEEKLEMVKGAYVKVVQGQHSGFYGQVMGLDAENARAIVKLATTEKIVTFPEFSIGLVNKKEFDKESKIINRATYEQYKRKHEETDKSHSSKDERDRRKKEKHSDNGNSMDTEHSEYRKEKKKESKHRSQEKRKCSSDDEQAPSSKAQKLWVRPQLRVRFIDDKYKKGRYFNKKVVVEDVLSSRRCSCKTEDGKYLDDISPDMLETVVPRDVSSYVMIVQGKYTGELCTILEKDKSKCMATVQLLSDRDKAVRIEYDAICEYVGDVSQFD